MNISIFGKSDRAEKLCYILNKLNTEVSGVYDTNLQSAVELAAVIDSKAYINTKEAIECSDVIILTDNNDMKTYLSLIKKHKAENKILCMISKNNTSDKIYTDNLNTHFSLYSPVLFGKKDKITEAPSFMIEGYGIRYTEFIDFITSIGCKFTVLSIEDAKAFQSILNLYTNGIETLTKILETGLNELSVTDTELLSAITNQITDFGSYDGSFFINDTHSVIKTLDCLKLKKKSSLSSLYKILGLNALEYTSYNKEEKEHFTKILIEN